MSVAPGWPIYVPPESSPIIEDTAAEKVDMYDEDEEPEPEPPAVGPGS
jgi:hypothetical protein